MPKKDTFTAAIEPNFTASAPTEYTVIFKENRPFELVINRKMYRWEPYESKTLASSEVNSDDFQSAKQYFTIIARG
jgi:hypothetical protein